MSIKLVLGRSRKIVMLAALAVGFAVFVAACGSDDNNSSGGGGGGGGQSASSKETDNPKCGMGNGKKATGTPIKLGGIATKQPGTDFTEIPATAKAFFACVNQFVSCHTAFDSERR